MNKFEANRVVYGKALCEIGSNPDIVAIDADLACCTMSIDFAKAYPERFYNVGIAEANMVSIAAGFAATGKIPFCHSFAAFTTGRCYDQVRNGVAYPELNVKLCGSHAGLTVGEDGATHQCLEDISLMRVIPGMTVVVPCDETETTAAVKAIAAHKGPCYIRTSRMATEETTGNIEGYEFKLGKGNVLKEGKDVTLIACGIMVQITLKAAELLAAEGISAKVIDMHTIKPIDKDLILAAAAETGCIVTAEEHNVIGGLGAAVAEVLVANKPVPVEFVGVQDVFGRSGSGEDLLALYGLTSENIAEKAKIAISRK